MDRRKYLKTLAVGSVGAGVLLEACNTDKKPEATANRLPRVYTTKPHETTILGRMEAVTGELRVASGFKGVALRKRREVQPNRAVMMWFTANAPSHASVSMYAN